MKIQSYCFCNLIPHMRTHTCLKQYHHCHLQMSYLTPLWLYHNFLQNNRLATWFHTQGHEGIAPISPSNELSGYTPALPCNFLQDHRFATWVDTCVHGGKTPLSPIDELFGYTLVLPYNFLQNQFATWFHTHTHPNTRGVPPSHSNKLSNYTLTLH